MTTQNQIQTIQVTRDGQRDKAFYNKQRAKLIAELTLMYGRNAGRNTIRLGAFLVSRIGKDDWHEF